MRTVVESPNRRLRREMGWGDPPSKSRQCAGDWMGLNCGDVVRERDGRHEGRVEAIHWGSSVKVRWLDYDWTSELPLRDVEKVKGERT